MSDYKSLDIVCFLYEQLGYRKISKAVRRNRLDLDLYINLLKFKSKKYPMISEMIDYFL